MGVVGGGRYGKTSIHTSGRRDGHLACLLGRSGSINHSNHSQGTLPPWVDAQNPQIWAPDILRREDGTFILFFSATTRSNPRLHCVGTAISDNIKGPYHSNSDVPFACPLAQGGAIDASAFRDDDGTRYVLYKIDGNALGHGGSCGNTVEPLVSTPIMIQCVDADWTTPIGDPVQILDRDEIDGPLVEAPTMIKRDGTYYLFFSSNCYITSLYDTSYATSTSPTGKFTKAAFPLLISGTVKETAGPGHADVDFDGVHIAFHAYATLGDVGARRALFVKKLDVGNEVVKLRSPAPPAGG